MADANRTRELAEVREALAGIKAVAAMLGGAQSSEVDRTAALRLIEVQAECAVLKVDAIEAKE